MALEKCAETEKKLKLAEDRNLECVGRFVLVQAILKGLMKICIEVREKIGFYQSYTIFYAIPT